MPTLLFGEYRPDVSDLNRQYTSSILNVVPQADGYGPIKDYSVYSAALAADCRGLFYARNTDGSVEIFAGTSTKLYQLDKTTLTWTDVSKSGGTYTALSGSAQWQFAQFNQFVVATQGNDDVQVFNLSSSSAFADLSGSPPRAAYVTVLNRVLVLSGLTSAPKRVQWSDLNDITEWSAGIADSQDLPDGGNVAGVVGGDFGFILQDTAIRRMVFVPGSDVVFDIDRIASGIGCSAPYSVVDAGGHVFFYTQQGFRSIDATGTIQPIGTERVDRTFEADYDTSQPQLLIGATDPEATIVYWTYKSVSAGDDTAFDKAMIFDYVLNKWSVQSLTGQYLGYLAAPGITLEGLNTIGQVAVSGAADNGGGLIRLTVASTSGWTTGDYKTVADVGGTTEANSDWTITVVDATHIDLQGSTFSNAYTSGGYVAGSVDDDVPISLDEFSSSTIEKFAVFNTDNKLCFFIGSNIEATLETAEQTGMAQRLFVTGLQPVTDADEAYCSLSYRESLKDTASYTDETQVNNQGFCPQRRSTRHARAKLRIAAGDEWTYATGIDPIYQQDGTR